MTRLIDNHKKRFRVEPICRVLQFAPSTYYAARQRPQSDRRLLDDALKVKIRHVHAEHFGVYGVRKLWASVTSRWHPCGALHGGTVDAGVGTQGSSERKGQEDYGIG